MLERLQARFGTPRQATWEAALSLASWLPPGAAYPVARRAGGLRYRAGRARMPVRPELERLAASATQLESWKRRQCELMAYDALELSLLRRRGRERIAAVVRIDGLEHLDAALAGGNGAILYSVHLCGIHTLLAGLAVHGYPLTVLRRAPREVLSPALVARARDRDAVIERALGCRFLRMEEENFGIAVQAANSLHRNEIVVALVDFPHSLGVEVEWLGARTVLAGGAARLAQVSGAPLLSAFMHREGGARALAAGIGPPLAASRDLEATVRQCASCLEDALARHPQGWVASPNAAVNKLIGDQAGRATANRAWP